MTKLKTSIKSSGEPFWKSEHYRNDPGSSTRAQLEAQMPTYRATPHDRACRTCGLTACLSLITDSVCA